MEQSDSANNGKLSPKKESPLTEIYNNNIHARVIYHMLIGCWLLCFTYTCIEDYLSGRELSFGLRFVKIGFGKLDIALIGWSLLFLAYCFAYFLFRVWAFQRITNASEHWNLFWILICVFYYICSFIFASYWIETHKLPHASAAVVSMESVRFLMKLHAFVRSNVPKVLNSKISSESPKEPHKFLVKMKAFAKVKSDLKLPTFSYFLYFLFIPKLLYKDSYALKESRDWKFIIFRALEISGAIFCIAFIFEHFLHPAFSEFGKRPFTKSELILKAFQNCISGYLYTLSIYLIVLHSWQNLFGELLKFSDRLLYQDWWNCTNYLEYFKKWNIVVHERLVEYIYKDVVFLLLAPKTNKVPKFTVFFISLVVHEWVVTFINGYFFPLCFLQFSVGILFSLVNTPNRPIFNTIFWISIVLGNSLFLNLFTIEYFANKNTSPRQFTSENIFIPKFIRCNNCIRNES